MKNNQHNILGILGVTGCMYAPIHTDLQTSEYCLDVYDKISNIRDIIG